MNLFKNTSSTYPASVDKPEGDAKSKSIKTGEQGFFSNDPILGDPQQWQPGRILSIENNRFTYESMDHEEHTGRFFVPAYLFDPENDYKEAEDNVYRVAFGKQVVLTRKITVEPVSSSDLPPAFKRWADLKAAKQKPAAKPSPAPSARCARFIEEKAPEAKLEGTYYFTNNPSEGFKRGKLIKKNYDHVEAVLDGSSRISRFVYFIDAEDYEKGDLRKMVCTKAPDGMMPPMDKASSSSKKGGAGVDRPLEPGDKIFYTELELEDIPDSDSSYWTEGEFMGVEHGSFNVIPEGGAEAVLVPYIIPQDVVTKRGGDLTNSLNMVLAIRDGGEIYPPLFRG